MPAVWAHVNPTPVTTEVTSVTLGTATGMVDPPPGPLPSCPSSSLPQHRSVPSLMRAHAWFEPAASCTGTTHLLPAASQLMSHAAAAPHWPSAPQVCWASPSHLVAVGLHTPPSGMGTMPPLPPLPIEGAPPDEPPAPAAPAEPPAPTGRQASLTSPPPATCSVPSGHSVLKSAVHAQNVTPAVSRAKAGRLAARWVESVVLVRMPVLSVEGWGGCAKKRGPPQKAHLRRR